MLLAARCCPVLAVDGYATINGNTTGGEGGPTVTVSNITDFATFVKTNVPYIVQVQGTIVTNSITVRSNKTIIGLGTNATYIGRLNISVSASNIIVRNLFISDPTASTSADGITIDDHSHHIWVDHCTFSDCGDGEVDISQASDFVTVSWCNFYYTTNTGHNFVNLIGASDTDTNDIGKLHVTFHHNWWSKLCVERMPRVRYGRVHVYNNYYNASTNNIIVNNYCVAASISSEVFVVNNVFERVDEPYRYQSPAGLMRAVGNATINCTGVASFNDPVFTPPYSYFLDETNCVAAVVTNFAGAGKLSLDLPFELWQLQNFCCTNCPEAQADADPDGDGMSNTNEFLSGTSPNHSLSALRIISAQRQGDDVLITWTTAGGRTNAVQATAGDANGGYITNFTDISGPIIIPSSGDTATNYTDSGGATNGQFRYYRVRLLP